MRQSRRNRRKKYFKDKLINFIAFFIIAPIISVFLGIVIVKHIILPNMFNQNKVVTTLKSEKSIGINDNSTVEEGNDTTKGDRTLEFNIHEFNIYYVQVGNFVDINNAKALLNQMKQNEIYGYIIKLENYKVFAGTFFTRQDADKHLKYVKQYYNDSFVSSNYIKGKKIIYTHEEKNNIHSLVTFIDRINSVYNQESSIWINSIKESNIKHLSDNMQEHNKELRKELDNIKGRFKSNDIVDFLNNIEKVLNRREKLLSTIDKNNFIQKYTIFNEILIEYINTIKMN